MLKLSDITSKLHLDSIFQVAQGRHTFFAAFFAVTAFVLAWYGKLTNSYAATITALQGMILAHSVKEDYFAAKDKGGDGDGK